MLEVHNKDFIPFHGNVPEAATEVFYRKVFLKTSQNSQENTCSGVSFE